MTAIEKLKRLADLLEADRSTWPADGDAGPPALVMSTWFKRNHEARGGCGTACCALGLACLDPVFQRLGLRLGMSHTPQFDHPTMGTGYGYWAGEQFFGLDDPALDRAVGVPAACPDVTNWLFNSMDYPPKPGPLDVARRVRAVIAAMEAQCQTTTRA